MDQWEDIRQRARQQNLEQFIQPEALPIEEAATIEQRARGTETPRYAARPGGVRKQSARRELVGMLSSRRTLRQAIILNEVIGLPKALRSDG